MKKRPGGKRCVILNANCFTGIMSKPTTVRSLEKLATVLECVTDLPPSQQWLMSVLGIDGKDLPPSVQLNSE
jgi:hypothetical protein